MLPHDEGAKVDRIRPAPQSPIANSKALPPWVLQRHGPRSAISAKRSSPKSTSENPTRAKVLSQRAIDSGPAKTGHDAIAFRTQRRYTRARGGTPGGRRFWCWTDCRRKL